MYNRPLSIKIAAALLFALSFPLPRRSNLESPGPTKDMAQNVVGNASSDLTSLTSLTSDSNANAFTGNWDAPNSAIAALTLKSPATFADLPLEIKSLVVAHVCANDREHEAYRSRAVKSEAALIKAIETQWHGRGLFAVAAVSKELNSICARHVFEVSCSTLRLRVRVRES